MHPLLPPPGLTPTAPVITSIPRCTPPRTKLDKVGAVGGEEVGPPAPKWQDLALG